MAVIGGLFIILAFVALLYGLFLGIFRTGRRSRGWLIVVGSMLVSGVAGAMIGPNAERGPTAGINQAKAAPTANQKEPARTISETAPQPTTNAGVLSQASSLDAYCVGLQRYDDLMAEADKKFGLEGTEEKIAWIKSKDAEQTALVEEAIGLPWATWSSYAAQHAWDQRCRAAELGWVQVDHSNLMASTSADASRVEDAVSREYLRRLADNEGSAFDADLYKAVKCRSDVVEGYRFVGCTLLGGALSGVKSQPYLYLVANQDDAAVIVPFEGETQDHMSGAQYPDYQENMLEVGMYVGPEPLSSINTAVVKQHFE